MNTGGDQGRDDYGLPPVDIEVPDDARELARDVQAYRRELQVAAQAPPGQAVATGRSPGTAWCCRCWPAAWR